jgi:hypothetical protein
MLVWSRRTVFTREVTLLASVISFLGGAVERKLRKEGAELRETRAEDRGVACVGLGRGSSAEQVLSLQRAVRS